MRALARWGLTPLLAAPASVWALGLGKYAVMSSLYFLLTWFPTYLVQARGMDFVKAGFLASPEFAGYQKQIVKNAARLAKARSPPRRRRTYGD